MMIYPGALFFFSKILVFGATKFGKGKEVPK